MTVIELADRVAALTAERDQLRAERDRYREHSVTLNTVGFKLAEALGDVPPGADQVEGNPIEQAERLIAALDRELVRTNLMAYQRGAILHAVHSMQLGNHTVADVAARVEEILKAGMSAEVQRGYNEALAAMEQDRDRLSELAAQQTAENDCYRQALEKIWYQAEGAPSLQALAATGLRLEVWDGSVPPGGYVCAVCRVPVESEPCEHGKAVAQ